MNLPEPQYFSLISTGLSLWESQVQAVLDLTAEGATVPFIARYRKEQTRDLDEKVIRSILELRDRIESLYRAKKTAITGIEEQGKLTPELEASIIACETLKAVDEIYKPFRLKKKTKAMIALEKGFGVVAETLKQTGRVEIPEELLRSYEEAEILDGVREIISAEVTRVADLREFILKNMRKYGEITSKKKGEKALEKLDANSQKQVQKFDLYADFSLAVSRLKPYQILALGRGESLGILSIKIEMPEDFEEAFLDRAGKQLSESYSPLWESELRETPLSRGGGGFGLVTPLRGWLEGVQSWVRGGFVSHPLLLSAISQGYRVLSESVENELRGLLNEVAELDAIETFSVNLRELLMTKPEYGKTLLAIDPWFRTGCKITLLDSLGKPVLFEKIFLHEEKKATEKLSTLLSTHAPEVIVVGNGTASNETIELLQKIDQTIPTVIVNEAWASVYSASEAGADEFPDLDATDRGTISIGRRYIDPLSELVKIPPQSIGVGMYQHDISEKILETKLSEVIEDTVNLVGINVNTASTFVLRYISGLDRRSAKKIESHRPYRSRQDLEKILGPKSYEQAIGFLRVPESPEPLDNTDIHPEQYPLARLIIERHIQKSDFSTHQRELESLAPAVTPESIDFIRKSYEQMGRDPRKKSTTMTRRKTLTIDSVETGMILEGVVRNVVAFGAFVDVGLKNDGLVHVSEIADRFIRDPRTELSVGQHIRARVTGVERSTGKIQLSIKQAE